MIKKINITQLKYYATIDTAGYTNSNPPSYCVGIVDDDHVIEITYDEISLVRLGNDPVPNIEKQPSITSGIFVTQTTKVIYNFLGGKKIEIYNFSQVIRHGLLPGITSSDTKFRIMKSLQIVGNMNDYRNFLLCRERDCKLSQLI